MSPRVLPRLRLLVDELDKLIEATVKTRMDVKYYARNPLLIKQDKQSVINKLGDLKHIITESQENMDTINAELKLEAGK